MVGVEEWAVVRDAGRGAMTGIGAIGGSAQIGTVSAAEVVEMLVVVFRSYGDGDFLFAERSCRLRGVGGEVCRWGRLHLGYGWSR